MSAAPVQRYCTPREAIAMIRPGTVKTVRLLFQARSNHVALVRVPKVHVQLMLRQLPENAVVAIEVLKGLQEATLAGLLQPVRAGELSPAAGVARRLS